MNTVKIDSKKTRIIAHRGLSGIERENTYPAFVAAGNRSYYGIETDVHKTADGKFVVIHDENTDRVTGGKTCVDIENSTYDSFKDMILPDLDGSFDRKDIKIPLLSDYIKICKKYEKICVLELKNAFAEADIKKMISEIEQIGYLENMIFISFDINNCITLRRLLNDAKIQWLTSKKIDAKDINVLRENRLDIDIYYRALGREEVEYFHSVGMEVNCWTCDSKEDAEKLVDMGIDYITTNILE